MAVNPQRLRYWAQRIEVAARAIARRVRGGLPMLLDVAGYVAIVIGVARLWGDPAWLVAGALMVLAGLRAQS